MFRKNIGDNEMSILEKIKDNFQRQPIILKLLYALLIISFLYDLFTGKAFSMFFTISLLLFIVAEFVYFIFYKEEAE